MATEGAGVHFPKDPVKGDRSTTGLNQGTFVAAVQAVDPKLAADTKAVKNWRFGYAPQLVKQVELACKW